MNSAGVPKTETSSSPHLPLRVTCWMARQSPVLSASIAVTIAVTGTIASWVSESPLMGFLATAALGLSTWRRWVPITFDITRTGVERTILGKKFRCTWQQVGRYEVRDNGIWLLPESQPTPGEFFCGLFIETDSDRESLADTIDYCFRTRHSSESSFVVQRVR